MWNYILIPLFFISFYAAAVPPAPTLARAASTAPAPAATTAAAAAAKAPAATIAAAAAAPPAAPGGGGSASSRVALQARTLSNAGTEVKESYLYLNRTFTNDSMIMSNNFFNGYHVDQLIATFKTSKKDFSFYLWPREVCSVVQLRGTKTNLLLEEHVITFKPMEQRVEVQKGGEVSGYYYPYTKVEFTNKEKFYQITHLGQDTDECRATFCPKLEPNPKDDKIVKIFLNFKFPETDYVNIITNNPFCSIRVNADVKIVDTTKEFLTLSSLGAKGAKGVNHAIPRNGRESNRLKGRKPDGGISVISLPGTVEGKYDTKEKAPNCCPRMSDLMNTDHTWNGVADYEHVTVAEYTFNEAAYKIDLFNRNLKSFLLEIKEPEKCPWVRLCFATASMGGSKQQCNEPNKNLEIFPKNGIMIRTDDDQAVMLGATSNELHTFRLEFTDLWSSSNTTNILAVRYGMASDVHTGINEFMALKMPATVNSHTIVLQRGAGCVARLNNDWQQTSLDNKSPNMLNMEKCVCHKQTATIFKKMEF